VIGWNSSQLWGTPLSRRNGITDARAEKGFVAAQYCRALAAARRDVSECRSALAPQCRAAHYEALARELGGEQTPPRYAFAYAPKQRLILISAGKVLNEEIYLDA
jgi:hypothetical protein